MALRASRAMQSTCQMLWVTRIYRPGFLCGHPLRKIVPSPIFRSPPPSDDHHSNMNIILVLENSKCSIIDIHSLKGLSFFAEARGERIRTGGLRHHRFTLRLPLHFPYHPAPETDMVPLVLPVRPGIAMGHFLFSPFLLYPQRYPSTCPPAS